jgi:hypothetical protein
MATTWTIENGIPQTMASSVHRQTDAILVRLRQSA